MAVPALIFSSLLFSIGYLAHVQKHSAYELKKDEEEAERFAADNYESGSISIDHADGNCNVAILRQLLLEQFENEKIYLRPDLKISNLAIILKSNRTYISKLINEEFNCSFSDFVGKYRIEEAKKLLQSSLLDDHTLESVAERTGFTSVASLIRTFKQFEGITPGAYRNKIRHSG
jgi:YesN/AraC family two-component response regulator